jgi:hypothetical protein
MNDRDQYIWIKYLRLKKPTYSCTHPFDNTKKDIKKLYTHKKSSHHSHWEKGDKIYIIYEVRWWAPFNLLRRKENKKLKHWNSPQAMGLCSVYVFEKTIKGKFTLRQFLITYACTQTKQNKNEKKKK